MYLYLWLSSSHGANDAAVISCNFMVTRKASGTAQFWCMVLVHESSLFSHRSIAVQKHPSFRTHNRPHSAQTCRTSHCNVRTQLLYIQQQSSPLRGVPRYCSCSFRVSLCDQEPTLTSGCPAGRWVQHGLQARAGEVQAQRQGCAGL